MKRWKRYTFTVVGLIVLAYAGACGYFWSKQVELIFLPLQNIDNTPDELGMACEEVFIPVGRGEEQGTLHGYLVRAEDPEAPAFLYLHGQDATIGKNLDHIQRLNQLGYHVLLIETEGVREGLSGLP